MSGQGNHAGTTRPADRKDPMIPAAAAVFAARRAITDDVMKAIQALSGQEYVPMYASDRKAELNCGPGGRS